MAKAVTKTKKTAVKSKPSAAVRAKPAPTASARKALKKSPPKPAPKPASKPAGKVVAARPAAGASKPAASAPKAGKWVFTFGDGKAEGKAEMRDLLGGKGANLAEMANLGLPVPPGFTIPTSVCTYFYAHEKTYPKELKAHVEKALELVERLGIFRRDGQTMRPRHHDDRRRRTGLRDRARSPLLGDVDKPSVLGQLRRFLGGRRYRGSPR